MFTRTLNNPSPWAQKKNPHSWLNKFGIIEPSQTYVVDKTKPNYWLKYFQVQMVFEELLQSALKHRSNESDMVILYNDYIQLNVCPSHLTILKPPHILDKSKHLTNKLHDIHLLVD